MLRASVEGAFLHRPENWLVRQLNDEPKLVLEVGLIRQKGKARARALQRSLESQWLAAQVKAGVFMNILTLELGGFSSLAMDSRAFSGELVWLAPLLGEGKQS
jgi:hypothetical protein